MNDKNINYKHWSWKNDSSYVSEKSYRYSKDMKTEIEHEIIKMEENKRAESSNRLSRRVGVIQTNINPFLKNNNYINDINNQEKYLRQKSLKLE